MLLRHETELPIITYWSSLWRCEYCWSVYFSHVQYQFNTLQPKYRELAVSSLVKVLQGNYGAPSWTS